MNGNKFDLGQSETAAIQQAYFVKVFGWMGVGLVTTGLIAAVVANQVGYISTPMFFGAAILELFLVFRLVRRVHLMSAQTAVVTFLGYSALNGFTLSGLFLIYTAQSVASSFFIAASIFVAMAVYGYTTKRDLTGMGSFLIMGLIGVFVAYIINLFIGSSSFMMAISFLFVVIFTGLTAYDVQKISQMSLMATMQGEEMVTKSAILGALTLYLDFINLFIWMLHLVGIARD